MKAKFFVATLAAISTFAVGSRANALSVTTGFQAFKAVGNPTTTNVPTTLNFANFGSLYSGPGILKKVRWIITAPATVGGNPTVTNLSTASPQTPTAAQMSYSISLTPTILGSALAGSYQSPASLSCTAGNCTNPIPAAVQNDDSLATFTKTYTATGTYTSNSVFASLTNAQASAFTSGTVASSYSSLFQGGGADLSWTFNTAPGTIGSGSNQRNTLTPFIEGSIALEYEYEIPAGAIVPGPVPLIGAAAAFGWSRRLKKRIASVA